MLDRHARCFDRVVDEETQQSEEHKGATASGYQSDDCDHPISSSISHTRSVIPAAMAGVIRSEPGTLQKL